MNEINDTIVIQGVFILQKKIPFDIIGFYEVFCISIKEKRK